MEETPAARNSPFHQSSSN